MVDADYLTFDRGSRDVVVSTEGSNFGNDSVTCPDRIPTVQEVFPAGLPPIGIALTVIACLITVTTLALFFEQMYRIHHKWERSARRSSTLTVLAVYPVVSSTSLLAVIVPRSGVIMDLVINVYLGVALFAFVQLMESYYGSKDRLCLALEGSTMNLRSPPCCCCLFCLHPRPFSRKLYTNMWQLTKQAALTRPVLSVIAAVMWTNGDYLPGVMSPTGGYLYLMLSNVVVTLLAMYGIQQMAALTHRHLGTHLIQHKMVNLQLVLISTSVFTIISSALVKAGVFPCSPPFTSRSRGERLNHSLLILLMLPLSVVARRHHVSRSKSHVVRVTPTESHVTRNDLERNLGTHDNVTSDDTVQGIPEGFTNEVDIPELA